MLIHPCRGGCLLSWEFDPHYVFEKDFIILRHDLTSPHRFIAISEDLHDFSLSAPYFLVALIFLLYVPLTLRIRSKRQIRMSSVLKDTLHFEMRDEGIAVSTEHEEEEAVLPWESIYKAVTTKHNLLIYSNRVNAYIIPKAQVSDKLPQIYEALRKHCDDYRLHIKGE